MRQSSESSGPLRAESLAGLCAIGGVVTGVVSIVVALFAFFDGPNYSGAGLALLAGAVAFGLLANALFRS